MSGLFITMEGLDGSGKTTQINLIKEYLQNKGFELTFVREPGSTKIGEDIRNIILNKQNKEMHRITEAFLYAASRAQLVNEVIEPALKEGHIVLCDRFVDSSIVYQGIARGVGEKEVFAINKIATKGLTPDITFFLNLAPDIAIKRKKEQKILDRLENENDYFYKSVYYGYCKIAKYNKKRIKIIDAYLDENIIHKTIVEYIENLFNKGVILK